MMLDKDDVARIVESVLSELKIEVESGHWTDTNTRTIVLKHGKRVLSTTDIDIRQKPE